MVINLKVLQVVMKKNKQKKKSEANMEADFSSVSSSSERNGRLWEACVYTKKAQKLIYKASNVPGDRQTDTFFLFRKTKHVNTPILSCCYVTIVT